MHDYLEAERVGQADVKSCYAVYPTCPVSLFNFLRTYSTPADKPANKQDRPYMHDAGAVDDSDPVGDFAYDENLGPTNAKVSSASQSASHNHLEN